MDEYLGIVKIFAGNFAPRGFMLCQGQILGIATNTALFSLLGTTYGGNGQTTFALPDLRGRAPVGQGQGPGLSPYALGEVTGFESTTLTGAMVGPHTHGVAASNEGSTTGKPGNNFLAGFSGYTSPSDGTVMNPGMVLPNTGGAPVPIIQPVLAINYIICTEGLYPSRN